MNMAHMAGKIRGQIAAFSGKLSQGLGKVSGRFVGEMLYGLQARQSVRLSEVGRSLEESTPLRKTIDRLSRNLDREGLWESVTDAVIAEGSTRVGKDTLLVIDPSDITKPYAEKMENLAEVRDASENRLGVGYWTVNIVGVECSEPDITPLLMSLWSQEAHGFESENAEILAAVDRVRAATGTNGLWVMDRGGDRRKLIEPFLERSMRFLIRMRGDRHVLFRGRSRSVCDVAEGCPMWYRDRIVKQSKKTEESLQIEYGFRKVRLPERDEPMWLLVIKGFGKEPLMVLTNVALTKSRRCLWWFVQAYLSRRRIEETIRFIKQCYDLEDIRVLTWRRLRNMMAFVLASSYFAAVYLGAGDRLEILACHVMTAAKRIFGIPPFRYYALADGVHEILRCSAKGPRRGALTESMPGQLLLFDDG